MRIIVGISGASGVIMGYRLLQALKQYEDIQTHLIISDNAMINFGLETDISVGEVKALAHHCHDNTDMAACISSGSFITDGMVIIPCSMKALSAVANGYTADLLARAADVCLKEGRKVVLVPREMPLGRAHLRNMQLAAENGCHILPPMLTFYNGLTSTEDQIQHVIGKVLMLFGLEYENFRPWRGGK